MGRASYSNEEKAAVMAALMAGQSVREVAAAYNIPRGTVGGWASRLNKEGVSTVTDAKKEEIGDLLVRYLSEVLTTLTAQAKVFADKDWLKKQDASSVAVLHGVLTDKAIRLLEALGSSE